MGLHHLADVKSYWSKGTRFKNVGLIMSKNNFFLLLRAFHFPEKDKNNKLSKRYEKNPKNAPRNQVNLYIEKLSKNFQKYYVLGKNIKIDESSEHFKRNPSKKFEFKLHLLSDYNTHYLYNMFFVQDKKGNFEKSSLFNENIVLNLLSCLNNDKKPRNLFFDEYYSSNDLMKKISSIGFLNATVLRVNSKEMKLKKINNIANEGKNNNIKDAFDYDIGFSSIERNTKKWYKNILFLGIDACILNAKILYESKTGKAYPISEFKEKIFDLILDMFLNKENNNNKDNIFENNNKK